MKIPRDHLLRGLLRGPGVRVLAAFSTAASRKARDSHGCAPTSAALLAQGLTAGALLAAALEKEEARVNLQLECDGPARGLFVDAGTDGSLRGYVKNPKVYFSSGPGEPLAPERALGRKGYVSVLRDLGEGELYRGFVELEACELGQDLERYFRVSEQVETAVGLSVLADGAEPLGAAGGVLVQRLPGGDAAAVERARRALRSGALDAALREGRTGSALFEALDLGDGPLELLSDLPLELRCRCSREKAVGAVLAMGLEEMRSLLADVGEAKMSCEFCGARYHVSGPELRALIQQVDERADGR
ncbi:MAG TPA: Hsp33 family molecular chaperone HslO [Myxococcales bacterium]|nr:Hsp33 family molecular chaperone HslO [Myxococcales bacterium]